MTFVLELLTKYQSLLQKSTLTHEEWLLLFYVYHDVHMISELVDRLGIGKDKTYRLLHEFEKKDIVQVTKSNLNRRHKLVELTPIGRHYVLEVIGCHEAEMVARYETLSDFEQKILQRLLFFLFAFTKERDI